MVETMTEENAAFIEEMMRDAKVAGESDIGVVHRGDEEAPAPMFGRIVRSATNVFIYNTVTREESKCNRNMLPRKLTLRRPDGSLVYTTRKPSEPPWRGTLKCPLHRDDPNREHYDGLGLPVCRKQNLPSPFQVNQHMKKRHPVSFETLKQERESRERQEDRDFQRSIIAQASVKPDVTPQVEKEFKCEVCEKSFDKRVALTGHMRSHK